MFKLGRLLGLIYSMGALTIVPETGLRSDGLTEENIIFHADYDLNSQNTNTSSAVGNCSCALSIAWLGVQIDELTSSLQNETDRGTRRFGS